MAFLNLINEEYRGQFLKATFGLRVFLGVDLSTKYGVTPHIFMFSLLLPPCFVSGALRLIEGTEELLVVAVNAIILTLSLVAMFSLYNVVFRTKRMQELLLTMSAIWPKNTDSQLYQEYHLLSMRTIQFLNFGCFFLWIACCIAPLIDTEDLPMLMTLPFSVDSWIGYFSAYAIQVYFLNQTLFAAVWPHCFYLWQINNICFLFDSLSELIKELKATTDVDVMFWINEEQKAEILRKMEVYKGDRETVLLVEYVKLHQTIIRLADILEEIYAPLILIIFILSSLIICMDAFMIKSFGPMAASRFLVGIIVMIGLIFTMSWFGDRLQKKSGELSTLVFYSNWLEKDKNHKFIIQFICMRAQKPSQLSLMGFTSLCFLTFSAVMTKAVSYFTLLNSMYERD